MTEHQNRLQQNYIINWTGLVFGRPWLLKSQFQKLQTKLTGKRTAKFESPQVELTYSIGFGVGGDCRGRDELHGKGATI